MHTIVNKTCDKRRLTNMNVSRVFASASKFRIRQIMSRDEKNIFCVGHIRSQIPNTYRERKVLETSDKTI